MLKIGRLATVAVLVMSSAAMASDTSVISCGFAPSISQTNIIYSTNYPVGVTGPGNKIESVDADINYDPPSFGTLQIRLCHASVCTAWQSYTNPNIVTTAFAPQDPYTAVRMEARVTYSINRIVNRSGKRSCATVYYNYP